MDDFVHSFTGHLRLSAGIRCTTPVATAVLATLGAFHTEIAAAEVLAVQCLNHGIGNVLIINIGEAEAATCAGLAIEN